MTLDCARAAMTCHEKCEAILTDAEQHLSRLSSLMHSHANVEISEFTVSGYKKNCVNFCKGV